MPRFRLSNFRNRLILLMLLAVLVILGIVLYSISDSAVPRSVLLFGLIGTLAVSIAWFASDLALVHRVGALVEASRKLHQGDFTARSGQTHGPDEIGCLAGAFDEMAAALETRQRQNDESCKALLNSQEQFRHVQKLQAMGQLAGGVAHDFNNLLTVITGYGEILKGSLEQGDPRGSYVSEMLKASQRAAGLTRQLLAFSRKQVLSPKVLDLNSVVADMDKMLRRVIGEDIALNLQLGSALGRVRADPGQLEQVLMNLAVNARDAMPEGGKLTVETCNVSLDETHLHEHPEAKQGPHVLLAVTDTGCGMSSKTMAHLFEPFFTTKGVGRGTGLGLSTVYGIVRQSEGTIGIASEPGKGTTVRIFLPRVEDEISKEEIPSSAAFRIRRGSETVLVVEDSDVVRKLVRDVLTTQGYCVLDASNGREAVQICEGHKEPIHLLLTDVVMPGAGGRDLALYLLSLQPSLKVLYMSGYAETTFLRRSLQDEGIAFIAKPFTPTQLARKVREVLDGAK